jgi:hypothetical protein
MDKKLFYAMAATIVALLVAVIAEEIRWNSIEPVTGQYYNLKKGWDDKTKRMNAIIHQSNGTVESDS